MVEFYLLTFPRFPLRKKEHKSYFGKNRTHDFRTSRCADYLLDHSGDEGGPKKWHLGGVELCSVRGTDAKTATEARGGGTNSSPAWSSEEIRRREAQAVPVYSG